MQFFRPTTYVDSISISWTRKDKSSTISLAPESSEVKTGTVYNLHVSLLLPCFYETGPTSCFRLGPKPSHKSSLKVMLYVDGCIMTFPGRTLLQHDTKMHKVRLQVNR